MTIFVAILLALVLTSVYWLLREPKRDLIKKFRYFGYEEFSELLRMCSGNYDLARRLVDSEKRKNPRLNDKTAIRRALTYYKTDIP